MKASVIEVESTLTDRYQTTVPETVRRALHLGKRDKIHYFIKGNGNVLITRADNKKEDPVISDFLSFLAQDIQKHPEAIQSLNSALYEQIQSLVAGVDIDLDARLDEDE